MTARVTGLGAGWRPELAAAIAAREDLEFVEVLAESVGPRPPEPVTQLRDRGLAVIVHGVGLSLGSGEVPSRDRLTRLAELACAVGAPCVSEHVAFVRGVEHETGHLLPVPRTRAALAVVAENVRIAQAELPVPLALENIAPVFEWPESELTEAEFLAELLERTDADLLLDVANLWSAHVNDGLDLDDFVTRVPFERIAYVHVAGGVERGGRYEDTHAHALDPAVLDLLEALAPRCRAGVLLERDDRFPPRAEWNAELDAIARTLHARGRRSA